MRDLLKPGLGFKDNKGMWQLSELDGVSSGNTHSVHFSVDKIVFGNYFYLPPTEVSPGRQLHHCFLQGLMTQARTFGKNGSCKTEPYVLYEIKVRPDSDLSVLATGTRA